MQINFLEARNGDSIWISLVQDGEPINILIDGGTSTTYSYKDKITGKTKAGELQEVIETLKTNNQKLDLVILTHIDDDHIDGLLKWFGNDPTAITYINEIWFNAGRTIKVFLNNMETVVDSVKFKEKTTLTSVRQGTDFENYIRDKNVWDERVIKQGDEIKWRGLIFQILSPSKKKLEKLLEEWHKKAPDSLEDTSRKDDYKKTLNKLTEEDIFEEDDDPYNGSSIAFILKKEETKYLFLGDSHPSDIVSALKKMGYSEDGRLKVELMKISHHGSRKNTSTDLLRLIETSNYVISTNGEMHSHPDKCTIARIVTLNKDKKNVYFNYPILITKMNLQSEKTEHPYVDFLGTNQL